MKGWVSKPQGSGFTQGHSPPCEFAATSVICVFLFAKLSKTLRLRGMCNRVQQSVSAVEHFHSCSMWHAGTCAAEISLVTQIHICLIKRITRITTIDGI